jgi:conjugal transfer pilus assembly protein TraA
MFVGADCSDRIGLFAESISAHLSLGADEPRLHRRELNMQFVLKKSGHMEMAVFALAVLAFALFYFAGPAFAGADTTFDTALTKFTDFLEGSGGKVITVLSLAGGIVALASDRFSMGQIAIPVGVGVGAGTGIPIVTSTVTATI